MEIYVVQEGDTINSIAVKFGISAQKIIIDNGLQYPYNLIIGQSIVIAYPKQTHIVQEGDSLQSISDFYGVPILKILGNNPELSDRNNLYLGESLVIRYDTKASIVINGFAFPYIKKETLIKTLPNLTYLSIYNYTASEKGEIITYQDDTEIIETAKLYHVVPLLLLTTLSQQGEPDIQIAYSILLNKENQIRNIENFIEIMKNKGYQGINIVFNFVSVDNQFLYLEFANRISERLKKEGYLFFITFNYQSQIVNNTLNIEKVDYSKFALVSDGLTFIRFVWGTNSNPPGPISNIKNIQALIDYLITLIDPNILTIGKPVIAYDWTLPFIPGKTIANSLPVTSALELAYNTGAIIQFDEESQTPFFNYNQLFISTPANHVVWFIDARSLKALNDLIIQYKLNGSGIWNIMIYYPQLWTLIVSQFDIIKLIE